MDAFQVQSHVKIKLEDLEVFVKHQHFAYVRSTCCDWSFIQSC